MSSKPATPQNKFQLNLYSLSLSLSNPLSLSLCLSAPCSYETADRATFEDSAAKFSISRSRTDCTEVSDETTSGISFKTEPFGPPSSPESTNDSKVTRNPDDCAGCGRQIQVGLHTGCFSLPFSLLAIADGMRILYLSVADTFVARLEPENMRRSTCLHIHYVVSFNCISYFRCCCICQLRAAVWQIHLYLF